MELNHSHTSGNWPREAITGGEEGRVSGDLSSGGARVASGKLVRESASIGPWSSVVAAIAWVQQLWGTERVEGHSVKFSALTGLHSSNRQCVSMVGYTKEAAWLLGTPW